ncbi:MAG: hypothetical protein HY928_04855 [Elusimicrobia bacterium]|nr:hypothetical protein [Elusimicrobiota bacterium]
MTALLLAAAVSTAPASPAGVSPQERRRALFLTDLLIEEGRHAEAEEFIGRRIGDDDDKVVWQTRLARLRSSQGRHADAAEVYRNLLAGKGEDAGLLMQLGLEEFAADDLPAARRDLERARARSSDPLITYFLSELAFSRGDAGEGRRLAQASLNGLVSPKTTTQRRTALRLRSRLGFDDRLNDDFGRLFDDAPDQPETLVEWVDALYRHDLHAQADEPLDLLRERAPDRRLRWRRLEAERLKQTGREDQRRAFLAEAVAEFPEERQLLLSLGEAEVKARRWGPARGRLRAAREGPAQRRWADELLAEVRRKSDHHIGPTLRWRESKSVRSLDTGLLYFGYPIEGLKLELSAGRSAWSVKSRGTRGAQTGASAAFSWETPDWTRTLDFDLRAAPGFSAASPGASLAYKPDSTVSASAAAALRRAWNDSTEAAAAGAKADQVGFDARARVLPRLSLGGQARLDRLSVSAGGKAEQVLLAPEAVVTLLTRPFYGAASWRFVSVDASGDSSFFAALPLQRRARAQYGTLSAGRNWLAGRLRADGYAFNGHDPEHRRNFTSFDLVGLGVNTVYETGPLELHAGWSLSLDDASGVGGRSQSVKLQILWRWEPR